MQLVYYKEPSGRVPVREFVDGQRPEVREKIFCAMRRLANFGIRLGAPYIKGIGENGIWRLKTAARNGACQTLYFY